MTKFEKKIKKLSNEFQVPEGYHEKVDEILGKIREDSVETPKKKPVVKGAAAAAVLCLLIAVVALFSTAKVAEAGFLESFRQTIMDFFGMNTEEAKEMGIESEKKEAVSKKDLMMELQEVVMDTQNIYAVVKITAPTSLEFKKGMTFDYFGFCKGNNYNVSDVMPGARECNVLEVLEGKENVASFVVALNTDQTIKEGKTATVFFQNLIAGPYQDKPDVLVEGMWSLSFETSYTSEKNITVKGTSDMQYPFAGKTADIKKIKLLPLGLTLVSDVSRVDIDTLHTTDTRFVIRMKMIDGSEVIVDTPEMEADALADSSSVAESQKKGRVYQKYVCQFKKAVDISQVLGIYIADYYVPLKDYE